MSSDDLVSELLCSLRNLGIQDADPSALHASAAPGNDSVDEERAAINHYIAQLPMVVEWLATVPQRHEIDFSNASVVPELQKLHNTVQLVRRLTSVERDPPLEVVASSGVVQYFVTFLYWDELPELQYEAAWAVMNIASGTSELTQCVVEAGALPGFINLLGSAHLGVVEQGMWGLGNCAGDGPTHRDAILDLGVLNHCEALCRKFNAPDSVEGRAELAVHRNFIWAMGNFVRSKPPPAEEYCAQALPMIAMFLDHTDDEALSDALWGLSYIADTGGCVEGLLSCIPQVIRHFQSEKLFHITPALRILGALCFSDDATCQRALELGALPCFAHVLQSPVATPPLLKEAFWAVSNICAGTIEQVQAALAMGLGQLAGGAILLDSTPPTVLSEAIFVVCNIIATAISSGRAADLMPELVEYLEPLVTLVLDGRVASLKPAPRQALGEALDTMLAADDDSIASASRAFIESKFSEVVSDCGGLVPFLLRVNEATPLENLARLLGAATDAPEEAESRFAAVDRTVRREDTVKKSRAVAENSKARSGGSKVEDDAAAQDPTGAAVFAAVEAGQLPQLGELRAIAPASLVQVAEKLLPVAVQTLCVALSEFDSNNSELLDAMLRAVTFMRKISSHESSPPLQPLIDCGSVEPLASLMSNLDPLAFKQIVFEAAWVLTNICSGTSAMANVVVATGVTRRFVEIVTMRDVATDLLEQCVWFLGNVAGDSVRFRDEVIDCGALAALAHLLSPQQLERNSQSLTRNAVWTFSNLCRHKPTNATLRENVGKAMEILAPLLHYHDDEALTDALWATSYLADGPCHVIQAICDAGVVPRVIQLLDSPNMAVVTPAIRIVGNVVTGNDAQTQLALNSGLLATMPFLLNHPRRLIRKEALWALSNITAGNSMQIQQLIDANLVPTMIQLLGSSSELEVRREAAWAISNMICGGTVPQLEFLLVAGVVDAIIEAALRCSGDQKAMSILFEAIGNLIGGGCNPNVRQRAQQMITNIFNANEEVASAVLESASALMSSSAPPSGCEELLELFDGVGDSDGGESGNPTYSFGGANETF